MGTVYISQLDAFELYHKVQEENGRNNGSSTAQELAKAVSDGLAGSAGASISNVITYPLDLIITRLQIQRQLRKNANEASEEEYKGLLDAAQKIYNNEGRLKGFFAGILSDTGKTIADSFIFFLLYDFIRRGRIAKHNGRKSLPAHEELAVGFVAGATTKLVTSPIANITTRQQAAALRNPSGKTPSFMEIANDIRAADGPWGFWSGYSASLVLTLNPSLTFFLFEFLKRVSLPKSKREHPPAAATFLLAALSKACASSVTYPFSLAKARLQAGSLKDKKEQESEDKTVADTIHSSNRRVEKVERKAARNTLLSTLLTIYKTEGPSALYEGLHLEVMKAFISHGITMSVKQAITRLISQVSYTLAIVFNRYTSKAVKRASRLAERAKDQGVEYYDLSIKRVNDKAQEAASTAKKRANEVAEFVHEYVEEDDNKGWQSLYGSTGLSKWLDERFNDTDE